MSPMFITLTCLALNSLEFSKKLLEISTGYLRQEKGFEIQEHSIIINIFMKIDSNKVV